MDLWKGAPGMLGGSGLLRLILAFFAIAIFAFLHFGPSEQDWRERYQALGVEAMDWPGTDARNIQQAAYCLDQHPDANLAECVASSSLVRQHYPNAEVPPLNYPSIWVRIYAVIGDHSEAFFRAFINMNTLAVAATIVLISLRFQSIACLSFLFCPILSLLVERGNVDGLTFAVLFAPILLASAPGFAAFVIGMATGLKVFPIFSFVSVLRDAGPGHYLAVAIGAAVSAPLMIGALYEIPTYVGNTLYGFGWAYGLPTLGLVSTLGEGIRLLPYALSSLLVMAAAALSIVLSNRESFTDSFPQALSRSERLVLLCSLAIFCGTFLLLGNWVYRLVFLLPAFAILARQRFWIPRLFCANLLTVMWMPLLPHAWFLLNVACYPLFIFSAFMIIVILYKEFPLFARHKAAPS